MTRKIVGLVVSLLTALSLLLASCAPAPPATPTTTAPTTTAPTSPGTIAPTTTAPVVDKPKYGGVLITTFNTDTKGFDNAYIAHNGQGNIAWALVNDRLMIGDWTMGPAGSNKTDFGFAGWAPEGIFRETGSLAESWEVPDDQTVIFKIRKGVRFQSKPPVNGREMNANDVVFSIKYQYLNPKAPTSYIVVSSPGGLKLTDVFVDPKDPWTVVVKTQGLAQAFLEDLGVKGIDILSPEVINQYGDLKDWHNAVGTGAFMLTDYVPGSSFTFVKNTNYWRTNPIGPGKGDQLPYIDGVKALILQDKSTMLAAFRTGKIDYTGDYGTVFALNYEDYQSILRTNPESQSRTIRGVMPGVGIRFTSTDPLAKPLLDQKVRWALSMAINREEMIKNLYSSAATYYVGFFPPNAPYYSSPEQMVDILQKTLNMKPEDAAMAKTMFEYHPDIAKKLLADAGYPTGFKTTVVTPPAQVDFLSVLKQYWAAINVDVTIDVKESLVYSSTIDSHNTQAMFYYAPAWISVNPAKWIYLGPGDPKLPFTVSNRNELSHPILDDYIKRTNDIYGKDLVKQNTLLQESEAWVMWYAPYILTPAPNTYRLWQPWVKNFYGLFYLHPGQILGPLYGWIDQDLKKSMVR